MLDNWQERFPNCEPVGYLMRTAFRERWVRFHSLPESKRYPEDESEYQIISQRHNCVLWELLAGERDVVLLTTGVSRMLQPERTDPKLATLDPDAAPWRTVEMHHMLDYPAYYHVFARSWEWRTGLFDPLIRLVAEDKITNVIIVHPECRWLLHPYDGGTDVIAETPAARDRIRAAHQDWLPDNVDGL